jgi:glutaconate CoA-transferase, subunit A
LIYIFHFLFALFICYSLEMRQKLKDVKKKTLWDKCTRNSEDKVYFSLILYGENAMGGLSMVQLSFILLMFLELENGELMALYLSLHDAAGLVQDGSTIALGGMTMYRRPVTFVRELLRRSPRPRDLTLLCFTAGYESDLLVGAGCVERVRTCYFGLESFGLAPMFTEAANRGSIEVLEETEASLSMGIRARAGGVGFMPSRAWIGTDLPKLRPDVKTVTDPYSGEELMAFPAIHCDVAVIHALAGDQVGNVMLNNNLGVDMELFYIATTVIVTVEKMVERLERSVNGLLVPAPGATHIVHAPRGAYPTSCYPEYPIGGGEIMRYVDACNAGKFDEYLDGVLKD